MSDSVLSDIKKVYYNPDTGYVSAAKLYPKMQKINKAVKMKDIK